MDLSRLKTFVAVYKAGNFAAVAAELSVDPSTVSRAIAGLEADLKIRLFNRTTRALTPTEAGDLFFKKVEPLTEAFETAISEISHHGAAPSGRLRVTASVSFGQLFLAPRLAEFRQAYPNIKIELILSDRPIDLVEERIDIAIRHGELDDSSMIARRLMDVSYRLVASPDYLAAHGTPKTPSDLTNHDLLTFPYKSFRARWRFERGDENQEIEIDPALTVSNAAALLTCVESGLGIALVADWTVASSIANGSVINLMPDWRVTGATDAHAISLIYPSQRFVPSKTRALADFLLDRVADKNTIRQAVTNMAETAKGVPGR